MANKKRKKSGWKIVIFSLGGAVVIMLALWGTEWWMERRAHFIRYQQFGTEIPVNYAIHGIDVSRYQDIIDWESVRDMKVEKVQIGFAFIKATEGLEDEDSYFRRNWKKIKAAGLPRGAYHYFLATRSGKAQAENFIHSVELLPGDLPPVLDIEQTYGVPGYLMRQRAKEWLQTVQEYYHTLPIIYTNVDFYKQFLRDEFDSYPLWVAHYLQKERPQIYRDWTFWQHSEAGRVNGIDTHVDFDVFNGDSTAFRHMLIGQDAQMQ
ncbi:MAG: GH25 family lysozyme [Bacteroidota bacterium]|nr:GH25 family lysozyme [Bacteroidota bacterium]MDP4214640.1 GH25 family lysozyme [Bacteroidota bacterium]MDP4244703.1 GH25 family lysozyme [Bacteroidota bacterium]MDP4253452.1 GH25 family lysozyme [Bacteroidota bacterium]MDP4258950.1 GH25 family lysozyme [Bacteroidota bacterium]